MASSAIRFSGRSSTRRIRARRDTGSPPLTGGRSSRPPPAGLADRPQRARCHRLTFWTGRSSRSRLVSRPALRLPRAGVRSAGARRAGGRPCPLARLSAPCPLARRAGHLPDRPSSGLLPSGLLPSLSAGLLHSGLLPSLSAGWLPAAGPSAAQLSEAQLSEAPP